MDNNWLWFAVAGGLIIIEILSYTTYALWLAVGAILTGLLSTLFPALNFTTELLIFSGFSVIGLGLGYKFLSSSKVQRTNDNILNQRGNQYINQVYTLDENIADGRSHLKIADTLWRIECDKDLPAGAKVRVVGVSGNKLIVEPIDGGFSYQKV